MAFMVFVLDDEFLNCGGLLGLSIRKYYFDCFGRSMWLLLLTLSL